MIILDENYAIENDVNNFTLRYEKETEVINKTTGKPIKEKDHWYYPTINGCIKKYFQQSMKRPETIQGLLYEVERVEQLIMNLKFK